MGFGSFAEYVERVFGYKPRTTREKLRVAEALEDLPALEEALRGGALSWCSVRELVRVVVPETELAWLDVTKGKTLRQLEELVAGKVPGDAPNAPYRPEARRHVLRFEVSADTYATFREAVAQLRRDAGTSLGDDATLLALARNVLGGPRDAGRAGHRVVLRVCPDCDRGARLDDGRLVPVSAQSVEMARCDGQEIVANDNPANVHDPHDLRELPDLHPQEQRPPAAANDVVSAAAHVGQRSVSRAKHQIPPATRRAVLERDQHRCRVPGCRHATFLDLHHIRPRAEGGKNQAANLITLCGAHHRAVHHGEIVVVRDEAGTVRFEHAGRSAYGDFADPIALELQAKVFAGLRGLGFPAVDARAVLAEVSARAHGSRLTAEWLLREALVRLGA